MNGGRGVNYQRIVPVLTLKTTSGGYHHHHHHDHHRGEPVVYIGVLPVGLACVGVHSGAKY